MAMSKPKQFILTDKVKSIIVFSTDVLCETHSPTTLWCASLTLLFFKIIEKDKTTGSDIPLNEHSKQNWKPQRSDSRLVSERLAKYIISLWNRKFQSEDRCCTLSWTAVVWHKNVPSLSTRLFAQTIKTLAGKLRLATPLWVGFLLPKVGLHVFLNQNPRLPKVVRLPELQQNQKNGGECNEKGGQVRKKKVNRLVRCKM